MDNVRQPYGSPTRFSRSQVNVFGRRSRVTAAARGSEGEHPKARSEGGGKIETSAGKSYFPSNGRHRYLNFLGRTSWESRDKLLVNRT